MKIFQRIVMALAVSGSLVLTIARAEEASTVTLSGVHLCCGACQKGVTEALADVEGAKVACDMKAKTVTITSSSKEAQNAALKALAKAGFHGKSESDQVKMAVAKAPKGEVTSLKLTGIHNCCGNCEKAIKATVASVEGAEEPTVDKKSRDLTVTGNFNARALVRAFAKAGLHVEVAE